MWQGGVCASNPAGRDLDRHREGVQLLRSGIHLASQCPLQQGPGPHAREVLTHEALHGCKWERVVELPRGGCGGKWCVHEREQCM